MRSLRLAVASVATLLVAYAPATLAQSSARNRLALEQYLDWEDVQNPQLSPDGSQILFTRRWIDKMNDRWESSIWIMNADGSHPRALVQGSDAEWSPDGSRVAYVAKGEPSGSQIFVRYMDAEGAATQISHLTETPSALAWSPDGRSIAFNMNVPVRDTTFHIAMPTPPKGAKWIEPPKIVTRLNYRSDRIGFTDDSYRHIFVIPADGGTARQITNGSWNHSAPAWSADGKWIAFSSLRTPDAEKAFRHSEIYAANVESDEIQQLTHRAGTNGNPIYSPDGRMIAFMHADSVDHSAWAESRLYVMNADGSNPRLLSGTLDRPISEPLWARDNSGVYYNVQSAGSKNLYFSSVAGQLHPVTSGTQVLTVSSVGRTGLIVGVRSTPTKPNDIVTASVPNTGATSSFTQLTDVNGDVLAGKQLGQTEAIWYTSKDGLKIQGWIVKPPGFDPGKKYPLILQIHGGPQSMYDVSFNFARQDFVANNYVLFYANPRGSTGYGEKFTNEIKNDYPDKDFDDLMAGVDTVVGRGYVDPKNMFVYGCSGGGVLTSWTVGHTDRFAAAAALCPVIDWISFVGETDGAGWYDNFEKPFWEDPSEYLRRSPIMYVGHVKTPTLLMTGVLDLRTPIPQIEEFYRALKVHGVPTVMIRMNNEYHGTSSTPSNFLRTQLYLRSWFEKWSHKDGTVTTTNHNQAGR
ncbi:MAG TPA: S9 family peptidase [Gemmatimonadaceae bacterium]|nr:S9 family peptidase [Gemmatimonadaceae bacterium]